MEYYKNIHILYQEEELFTIGGCIVNFNKTDIPFYYLTFHFLKESLSIIDNLNKINSTFTFMYSFIIYKNKIYGVYNRPSISKNITKLMKSCKLINFSFEPSEYIIDFTFLLNKEIKKIFLKYFQNNMVYLGIEKKKNDIKLIEFSIYDIIQFNEKLLELKKVFLVENIKKNFLADLKEYYKN